MSAQKMVAAFRLADHVDLRPPIQDPSARAGEPGQWTVTNTADRSTFRLSEALGELALAVRRQDGTPLSDWAEDDLERGMAVLEQAGLTHRRGPEGDGGGSPRTSPAKGGRLRRRISTGNLVVRFDLMDSNRVVSALPSWLRAPGTVRFLIACGYVLGALGILVPVLRPTSVPGFWAALHADVDAGALALVWLVLAGSTLLHESAHALALKAFGGAPGRFGAMIFYFTPAFYCDVTDVWRLPRRADRVRVGLAGLAVNAACAGASSLAVALLPLEDRLAYAAQVLALASYLLIAANVVPFVKLDGYVALSTGLDWPFLRRDAMAAALRPSRRTVPDRGGILLRAFGTACLVFPFLIVSLVIYRLSLTPVGDSVVGRTLIAVCVVIAAAGLYRGALVHWPQTAPRGTPSSPRPRIRPSVPAGITTVAVVLLLASVPVLPGTKALPVHLGGPPSQSVLQVPQDALDLAGKDLVLRPWGYVVGAPAGTVSLGADDVSGPTVGCAALIGPDCATYRVVSSSFGGDTKTSGNFMAVEQELARTDRVSLLAWLLQDGSGTLVR